MIALKRHRTQQNAQCKIIFVLDALPHLVEGPFPPDLNTAERETLTQEVKDWSIAHGLTVRLPPVVVAEDPEGILATNVPVTLFPSPFPKGCFVEAKAIQQPYNELYANISRDEDFLRDIVQE